MDIHGIFFENPKLYPTEFLSPTFAPGNWLVDVSCNSRGNAQFLQTQFEMANVFSFTSGTLPP